MPSIDDKLRALQRQFADALPDRLQALRVQHRQISPGRWEPVEAQNLHHQLHGLTGSAGTFGLPSLSAAARQLEIRVKAVLDAGAAPSEAAWAAIGEELAGIEQMALSRLLSGAPDLPPPEALPRLVREPFIHLVEDDPGQAEHLSRVLRDDGYRVTVFTSLGEFRAEWESPDADTPDAIVLDMVFPEGDSAGVELLAELQAGRTRCPPVVFASVRDDLDARLGAFRAGASRYLVKPVEPAALVDLLDSLTGRIPPEPYRVLLVDDDPMLLEAQASVLRAAGMTVHALLQPRETLAVLDSFSPDVVVLDVYMPDVSGPELAAILRERDNYLSLPILFLSGETDMSQQLLALNLGGDDFLVKPVRAEHLVSAVTARARRARQNAAVRSRLQTTLYEREREHLALENHALVSIADGRGNIIYANERFCRISGYSREELLGQNHRILKSNEHSAAFYRDMWRTINGGSVWNGEICNRSKDGRLYWVNSTITPFLASDGKPYQYVSIRTDITHVKEAEAAERAQSAMRKVVSDAAAGLLAADADTLDAGIELALRQACEHLGTDRAHLFLLCDDGAHMSNTHEWCAPGIAARRDELQEFSLAAIPWLWSQIRDGEAVIVPDVAALPPEASAEKSLFQSQGINALCGFPIRRGGNILGFIGFDQIGVPRDCNARAVNLLGLLGGLMGSALLRAGYERDIQSQQRFTQSVLDSVSAHIAVLNRDGVIIAVNEPWRSFGGQNALQAGAPAPNAGVGADYLKVVRQAEAAGLSGTAGLVAGVESVMAGHAPDFRHEYTCHSPDVERWFEMTVMPLRDGGGGVVISHSNITERKLAERNVKVARDRLRRGQVYANIGTWEWHIASGELFWTERIAPLFGYPEGDLETSYENFLGAVHPEDRQSVSDAVTACIEEDIPYDIEHRVVWPDGTVRWLQERGAVTRDRNGRPLQMLGVVQDIDDRKRAERSLQLFKHVVDSALDGVVVIDPDGIIQACNPAACDIFGYAPSAMTGNNVSMLMPQPMRAEHDAFIQRYMTTGEGRIINRQIEVSGLRSDGTGFPLEVSVSEIHVGKETNFVGLLRDITDRKQAEETLVAAREEASRANLAKSDFLSSMSHELRTPMNAILGFGQLMEYDDTLPPEHQDSVKEILKAGDHLLTLINEVLDLAKVESGSIELSLEPVELCPVIGECLSLVGTLAAKRDIGLSRTGARGAVARADRTRLKQALLNLLSNAIKYNREGGSVTVDVEGGDDRRVRIRVTDTGRGIPPERLAELFQPFTRLGAEATEIEGTGIGLTITRRIVDMMGGSVEVESETGVGSTFCIELPLEARPGAGHAPADSHAAGSRETDSGGHDGQHTVLCIEDNPSNIRLLSQLFARLSNVHLLTADTPEWGIELALEHRPDLILLDINMPGMDGYQVLSVFQAEASLKHLPVIAITANAMPQDIERGLAAGFVDYLTKPLNTSQLLDTVQRCLTGDTA